TYYVDGSNAAASDAGPGSASQPFKTLQGGVNAQGFPGNTLIVKPATYRESVTFTRSGSSSSPITVSASGSGVIVSGSDDFSGTSRWTSYSGDVYLASGVRWRPLQVFADGERLTLSSAGPGSLPANAFTWVSGAGLYVNLGGANPGSRKLEGGRRRTGLTIHA